MSTGNVPSQKPIVNKLLERVKEQDERNHTFSTSAKWPAQGGLFGKGNPKSDDQQPPEEAPSVVVGNR